MKSKIRNLLRRLPLTFKMITVCLAIGIGVWYALDRYHTEKVRMIFIQKLKEELSGQAEEDRLRLDRYIKLHNQSVRAFTMFKGFGDYVGSLNWSKDDTIHLIHHKTPPSWYPPRAILRMLAGPRFVLLLDQWGNVRELYPSWDMPPAGLFNLPRLKLLKSRGQSYMTNIDGRPFLLSSKAYHEPVRDKEALLLLATPIDEEFLTNTLGPMKTGHVTALVRPGNPPSIMTSTDLYHVPPNITLDSIRDRYMIMGKAFFDYGASDLVISLVSLLSLREAERLTKEMVGRERQAIAGVAIAFIITFTSLMLFITHRIRLLTHRISNFAENTLGIPGGERLRRGDKLYILEQRFMDLMDEVVAVREDVKRITKMQAEEKTRVIVESAFDAIVTIDSEGRITTWNPQAERVFGWKMEEAIGKDVAGLIIPEEFREAHKRGLKGFLLKGKGRLLNQQIEIYAINKDGETFPVELTVSHAKTDEGDIFIAVLRDITERKQAEERIKASLHEKGVLLREIHHRVKNNMQVISSLLRLQAGKKGHRDEIELLNESQNRIRSMALVHEKLYRSRNLAHVDFKDYINDLVRGLYRAYGVSTERVRLNIDVSDVWLGVDTAIPCGLIVNELISNALKYAFPDDREGKIYVGLREIKDIKGEDSVSGVIELIVRDDGIGLPDDMDIRKTESLGLRLVTTLVENQLKGSMDVERDKGTIFRLRFKGIGDKTSAPM